VADPAGSDTARLELQVGDCHFAGAVGNDDADTDSFEAPVSFWAGIAGYLLKTEHEHLPTQGLTLSLGSTQFLCVKYLFTAQWHLKIEFMT